MLAHRRTESPETLHGLAIATALPLVAQAVYVFTQPGPDADALKLAEGGVAVIPTAWMRRDYRSGVWLAIPACAVHASNEFDDFARPAELWIWRQPLGLGQVQRC
jgi:hypothetical protein